MATKLPANRTLLPEAAVSMLMEMLLVPDVPSIDTAPCCDGSWVKKTSLAVPPLSFTCSRKRKHYWQRDVGSRVCQ